MNTANVFLLLGSLLAALAVGLGAIGAHALKDVLDATKLANFHTAVQYQMYHALGLILIGILALGGTNRWLTFSGWTMLAGVVLFSGFLYAWIATGRRELVMPVPVGGVAFIVAWVLLAIGTFTGGQR